MHKWAASSAAAARVVPRLGAAAGCGAQGGGRRAAPGLGGLAAGWGAARTRAGAGWWAAGRGGWAGGDRGSLQLGGVLGARAKYTWPPGLEVISKLKSPIPAEGEDPLEKELVPQSDEEMEQEGKENIKKAEAYIQEHIQDDMSEEQIRDLVARAMEACIPPPPSWQEMFMLESEKKTMTKKGSAEANVEIQKKRQEAGLARVPKIDEFGRAYATGRRKTSVARVWVTEGTGNVIVNRKMMVDYFARMAHREEIFAPLRLTGKPLSFDVWATAKGGGLSGQAQAIRHGIAQALQPFDMETYRPLMKRFKYLTYDARQVERKKPGQPKARKKFQWVKR